MSHVSVQNDGHELLSLANNPTHVVDIDISHNYFGELILIVLIGYFVSCSCCFCTYAVIEVRTLLCTHHLDLFVILLSFLASCSSCSTNVVTQMRIRSIKNAEYHSSLW